LSSSEWSVRPDSLLFLEEFVENKETDAYRTENIQMVTE
jgi:hypothetical protein